jgi:hypothetical protein
MAKDAAVANFAQQQSAPVLLPHNRQLGGASQANRRADCHNILNLAAFPWLPARQNGENLCENC